eukprot:5229316-Amphidinium_carterae.1
MSAGLAASLLGLLTSRETRDSQHPHAVAEQRHAMGSPHPGTVTHGRQPTRSATPLQSFAAPACHPQPARNDRESNLPAFAATAHEVQLVETAHLSGGTDICG